MTTETKKKKSPKTSGRGNLVKMNKVNGTRNPGLSIRGVSRSAKKTLPIKKASMARWRKLKKKGIIGKKKVLASLVRIWRKDEWFV